MHVSTSPPSDIEAEPLWLPFYVTAEDKRGYPAPRRRGPSPRNREIYHAVRVLEQSLREVARSFALSHTRVSQIVRQVEDWIAAANGGRRGTAQSRLTVAEELHHARLNHLFGKSLAEFEQSRAELRVSKVVRMEGKPDRREVTFKSRSPDRRFLETALKAEQALWEFALERHTRDHETELSLAERQQEVAEALANAEQLRTSGSTPAAAGPLPQADPVADAATETSDVPTPAAESAPNPPVNPPPVAANETAPPSASPTDPPPATVAAAAPAPQKPTRPHNPFQITVSKFEIRPYALPKGGGSLTVTRRPPTDS